MRVRTSMSDRRRRRILEIAAGYALTLIVAFLVGLAAIWFAKGSAYNAHYNDAYYHYRYGGPLTFDVLWSFTAGTVMLLITFLTLPKGR